MSAPNRAKSAVLCVKSRRRPWVCIVATMLASWTCLLPMAIEARRPRRLAVTAGPSSAIWN